MDSAVSKALQDKLYDKRKAGALELESVIRNALAEGNHDKIARIVHQLCHDYAYAVHHPHARNGGLIGLAAAAIALGSEVARYLHEIVPPVLACFSDQDARVRYYACESMYNIAKVAKGEVLLYFNDVFDALCKLAADTELSVKNGAELLDRLVKDIVSESAATYASILVTPIAAEAEEAVEEEEEEEEAGEGEELGSPEEQQSVELPTAFSLPRFIPLLQERIHVLNPFTRTFLVSWITLLDSIPDLELVAYLPSFLGGLLKFLSDPNQDVHTTTKVALDRFLTEIKKIAAVKKGIAESRKSKEDGGGGGGGGQPSDSTAAPVAALSGPEGDQIESAENTPAQPDETPMSSEALNGDTPTPTADGTSSLTAAEDDDDDADDDVAEDKGISDDLEEVWIPGQDVRIDYQRILDILVTFLSESAEEEIQVTALKWIESFLDICPEDILFFTPRLLAHLLPALSHDVDLVKQAAGRVNQALMAYIVGLPEDAAMKSSVGMPMEQQQQQQNQGQAGTGLTTMLPAVRSFTQANGDGRRESASTLKPLRKPATPEPSSDASSQTQTLEIQEPESAPITSLPAEDVTVDNKTNKPYYADLDYEAAVNALTLQFLHEHEATRVAALAWLIMLHRKSPRKILAIQDATFPALLKTLSDPAEAVVTRDLLLLSQISKSSDDSYFTSFMVNLLKLFTTDRRLLESRGNLIIRQLCLNLSPEKIYRTMADCLEHSTAAAAAATSAESSPAGNEMGEEPFDLDFSTLMVQNLNNNLLTAPELSSLRKQLRSLSSSPNPDASTQTFFTALFRAWCVNAVATFSLCLLAQAYEPAYHLLQIISTEIEMTVEMLIQIDKLVQLLESPVFTYLRMQLLEPERWPFLYKCLFGVLMLLPQSSAFAALKNRLGSVSAIGVLGPMPAAQVRGGGVGGVANAPSAVTSFERQNRLKTTRDAAGAGGGSGDGIIKWGELLEKFKSTQERVRRNQQRGTQHEGVGVEEASRSPPAISTMSNKDVKATARALMVPSGIGGSSGGAGGMRPGSSSAQQQLQQRQRQQTRSISPAAAAGGGPGRGSIVQMGPATKSKSSLSNLGGRFAAAARSSSNKDRERGKK